MRSLASLVFVAFGATALAQTTVTFTPFGRACGADLAGAVVRATTGAVIRFDVSNAAPLSVAVLVMGQQLATPLPLPGSNCGLLVNPRATLLAQVDATGAAAFRFPMPRIAPVSIDLQAVTIALSRNGRTAEASNGLTLDIR